MDKRERYPQREPDLVSLVRGVTAMTAIPTFIPFRPTAAIGAAPLAVLRVWQQRRRERAELRRLLAEPRLLADTGLDRRAVAAEAGKPFWVA